MKKDFKHVRVLVWDFDGTLYKPIPELWKEIREAEYQTIMDHTGWSHEKTAEEFTRLHTIIPSATATVASLSGITTFQAALYGEGFIDRKKYLHRDPKLVQLFKRFYRLTHYLLVNGVRQSTRDALGVLGISPEIFTEIVTSEIVGENKPGEKGFRYILGKTGLPPGDHLMIGDRETVDLVPAKKLGMKTCLVWADQNKKFSSADIILPTVYDVKNLVLS